MSGSCHLNRESNAEVVNECQIFGVVVISLTAAEFYNLGNKGALTQKR